LNGASEVGLAITVSTLTTLVVFLPLIFMEEGVAGARMAQTGLPVVYALAASLVVALLVVPRIAASLVSGKGLRESRLIGRLGSVYGRGIRWTMDHRVEAFLIACAVSTTVLIPMGEVKDGRPSFFWPRANIRILVPSRYTIEQRDTIVSKYEKYALENREKYGATSVNMHMGRNYSFVGFSLPVHRPTWYSVLSHRIKTSLGMDMPKVWTRTDIEGDFKKNAPRYVGVFVGQGPRRKKMETSVSLFGDDIQTLEKLAPEVERRLSLIPGVTHVEYKTERGSKTVELDIRTRYARACNITPWMIANAMKSRGVDRRLSRSISIGGKRLRINVGLDEDDKTNVEQLLNRYVTTSDGKQIRVGALVDVRHRDAVGRLNRHNGRASVQISATTSMMAFRGMRDKIQAAMAGFELPTGYIWSFDRWIREQKEENKTMRLALTLAIILVFLLMGILFESFLLPLAILLTVPLSFLGVYWILYLTDTDFTNNVWMGMIILVGIVVNNAIVLVDLVNKLRAEGYSRKDAVIEAGQRRFRPILMTSLTTICGLIPMSVEGAQSVNQGLDVLGKVLIGGLTTSTFLTLFVVPLFYTFLDDARGVLKQVFNVSALRS
jgi:hydrophobic/amphiphilic exporter-1 (mainly G- bacteria), HAE1 family